MTRVLPLLGALAYVSVSGAQEPDWLTKARAREGTRIPVSEIRSADNWFTAKVPAKLVGKIEKADGSYSVELDFGGEANLYCEVVPDGLDLADSLRRGLEGVLQETANSMGKIEARAAELVDAGAYGPASYIRTRWAYRINNNGEKQLGGLQQIAFERPDVGVYCNHVDIGYVKTFETVTRAFAESLTVKDATVPYYREVVTWSFRGMNLGVGILSLIKDADGDTLAEADISMLMPGAEKVASNDTVRREWVRPDRTLINAVHVVASNGELTTDLKLNEGENGWKIVGTHDGKEVANTLAPGLVPGSWVTQALELRDILASDKAVGAEHSIPLWQADKPLTVSDYKTKVVGRIGGAFKATSDSATEKYSMVLERDGTTSSGEMSKAGTTITLKRVFVDGSF